MENHISIHIHIDDYFTIISLLKYFASSLFLLENIQIPMIIIYLFIFKTMVNWLIILSNILKLVLFYFQSIRNSAKMTANPLKEAKKAMRKEMGKLLAEVPQQSLEEQTKVVLQKVGDFITDIESLPSGK